MPSMWTAQDHRDDGNALMGCWFAVMLALTIAMVVAAYRWLI
jgi:hypothetical protein